MSLRIFRWNLRKSIDLTSQTDNVKMSTNSLMRLVTSMHFVSSSGPTVTACSIASMQEGWKGPGSVSLVKRYWSVVCSISSRVSLAFGVDFSMVVEWRYGKSLISKCMIGSGVEFIVCMSGCGCMTKGGLHPRALSCSVLCMTSVTWSAMMVMVSVW